MIYSLLKEYKMFSEPVRRSGLLPTTHNIVLLKISAVFYFRVLHRVGRAILRLLINYSGY